MDEYRTTSLNLATYLLYRGCKLMDIEKEGGMNRRSTFVFVGDDDVKKNVSDYNYAPEGDKKILIDPRKYMDLVRQLKERLYNN